MALDTHQFNLIRDDIRGHFRDYLSRRGYDASKQFKCPNPAHADKHPSAGVVKSHPAWGHCFACGCSFDIFTLCVWEESKPSTGAAWYRDVFLYLADKFNIVVPDLKLSSEDLLQMELASAYSHASQIVRSLDEKDQSEAVVAKLKEYGWGKDIRYQMGIGSVKSYDDFIKRMTKNFGHKLEFLIKADLANQNLFNENFLIYTIRDADGQPIGFSARDLKFEEKDLEAEKKAGKEPKFKPKKYCHTANNGSTVGSKVRETLFQKSETIFNFDLARKAAGALVVMEGNADCATAYAAGIHTAVAALGGAFQRSHIEQAIAAGKDHIILVFDRDKSGKDATKRTMKLVEDMGGKIGLRVEVLQLPDGFKDPDQYLRSFGDFTTAAREFRMLPRIDMFSWRLQMAIENGEDKDTLCEQTIPLIINEESNLVRQRMADQLAQVCEYDREIVRREVLRLTDRAAMKLDEQRTVVSQELLKKIRQDPKNLSTYLLDAQSAIEAIDKKAIGYDPARVLEAAKDVYNQLLRNTNKYELKTGFDIFDEATGGIPRKGLFGTLPGKSHHGKSVWMDNLIIGLINKNPDIIVVLHTVDDPQIMRVQRLLGARTGIASKYWRSSGYFLHDHKGVDEAPEDFEARFNEAWDWYFTMMKEERLIVVDSSTLTPDLMTLRGFLADIQRRHPGKTVVFFGDNFHLYDLQTQETGEQKISKMSVFVTTHIIGELGLSAIFTVEIPKNDFEPGHRPSYQNLKGTGRLTFDSKVNMTVYSQTQDWVSRPDKQLLYWESPLYQEEETNGDNITCMAPIRLPIVEIIIDKNKINGVTKTIFFRMDKFSGQMKECGSAEQDTCRDKLVAAAASEKAAWKSSKSKHHDN